MRLHKQYPEIPFTFKRAVLLTDWKEYTKHGNKYRIRATVRFDDQCGNGHRTFSITAETQRVERGCWSEEGGGCCHDLIAKHFPDLSHAIPFHLCSTYGPLHYIANTVYLAGDRDYHGLRKGESRQLRNGKTGLPCWKLVDGGTPHYVDAETCPPPTAQTYEPWCRIGEGKERQLDAAREAAIWPEATDEELSADPETLKAALAARLPELLERFRSVVEGLGFAWDLPSN